MLTFRSRLPPVSSSALLRLLEQLGAVWGVRGGRELLWVQVAVGLLRPFGFPNMRRPRPAEPCPAQPHPHQVPVKTKCVLQPKLCCSLSPSKNETNTHGLQFELQLN